MPYTHPCTATPKCTLCAPLYTDLYPRFGASKLKVPAPKTYPILFTNTFSLTPTPASLLILSAIEDMESTIEMFIQENSFPEYRDIPAPVYRLLTITDSHDHDHGHDAETVKKMMKENTKAKEVSVSMSLTLTLTLLIDFPEKQHIGPEKMGWLFGEFPAVPISSWERRGPDEGETRHASLARLEFFRGVLRAEGEGRVVFGPE
ncbi:hypothetical protein BJX66DRAFT_338407 [Aspergillus keveii]|uniref:Uncharacterized protein n=1 Tax=Aspergillus keveii TaxID=714993 RepID=A0ABR4G472_9EURO